MTTEVHWTHPIEDLIAVNTVEEIINYYFNNFSHRNIFEREEILKFLESKFDNLYNINSFQDFVSIFMTLNMKEEERMEYVVDTNKRSYFFAHIDNWIKENPDKIPQLYERARRHNNIHALKYLKPLL